MSTRILRNFSIGYLLLPTIIFIINWFKPLVALPIIGILGIACWINISSKQNKSIQISLLINELCVLVLLATVLTALSGVNGYFYQFLDFWSHNAKYYTVFTHAWPVFFEEPQQYASHYFGMYLIPAIVSKLMSTISGLALFLWAVTGYTLALAWIYIASNKSYIFTILFFLLGSTAHLLKLAVFYWSNISDWSLPFVVEIWSIFYQSQHAFNQLIPTLIISGVLFYDYRIERAPERGFFVVTLHFVFGIFPTITLVFASLLMISVHYYDTLDRETIKKILNNTIWAGVAIIPTCIYFLSGGGVVTKGFIWEFASVIAIAKHFVFGIVLELSFLVVLFYIARPYSIKDKLVIIGLLLLIFISANYRIGKWNDWFMRGNMPLLSLLLLFLINKSNVLKSIPKLVNRYVFYSICLLSSVIPIKHIVRALQHNYFSNALYNNTSQFEAYPYDTFTDFYQMGKVIYSEQEASQYAGAKGSIYERYLAPSRNK